MNEQFKEAIESDLKQARQQLADLALAADQEARYQRSLGNRLGYLRWKLESRRLCAVLNKD